MINTTFTTVYLNGKRVGAYATTNACQYTREFCEKTRSTFIYMNGEYHITLDHIEYDYFSSNQLFKSIFNGELDLHNFRI